MVNNPLDQEIEHLSGKLDKLREDRQALVADRQWYESTDREKLVKDSDALSEKAKAVSWESDYLQSKINEIEQDLANHQQEAGSLANPLNWFSEKKQQHRQKARTLTSSLAVWKSEAQSVVDRKKTLEDEQRRLQDTIDRYDGFDPSSRQHQTIELEGQIVKLETKLEAAKSKKIRVDAKLQPLRDNIASLESRKRDAESAKQEAGCLERELSAADNSYKRAMVHKRCESRFGEGSPQRVLGRQDAEIRKVERDLKKAQRRASELLRVATREIDTLILDGNNLCYEGGDFIGFAALDAIVPRLRSTYDNVVLVFDAAIRRQVAAGDREIQDRFGRDVTIHVVSTSTAADETVLDLADRSETTFIVSNDRFSDFNEKAAVKGDRVIRHEIVNGHVFIHDLDLRVSIR